MKSIRTLVTLISGLLMLWLVLAFVHTPTTRSGIDPISPDTQADLAQEAGETVGFTVSASP